MEAFECSDQILDLLPVDGSVSDSGDGAADDQEESFETDPKRLLARQKQIDFAKNTIGYERYLQAVPKEKRRRLGKHHDPPTPDITKKMSKRTWDGIVKSWRRHLHKFDNKVVDTAAEQDADAAVLDASNTAARGGSKRSGYRRGNGRRHQSNAQHIKQQQGMKAAADSNRECTDIQSGGISKPRQQQTGNKRSQHRDSSAQVLQQEQVNRQKDQALTLINQCEPQLHDSCGHCHTAAQYSSRSPAVQVAKQDGPAPTIRQREEQNRHDQSRRSRGEGRDPVHSRDTMRQQHRSGASGSGARLRHQRSSLYHWESDRTYDREYWASRTGSSRLDKVSAAANDTHHGRCGSGCSGYHRSSIQGKSSGQGRSIRTDNKDRRSCGSGYSMGCSSRPASPKGRDGKSAGSRSNRSSQAVQEQQQQRSTDWVVLGKLEGDWSDAQAVTKQGGLDCGPFAPALRRQSWADCVSDEEEEGECCRPCSRQITPAKRNNSQVSTATCKQHKHHKGRE